MKLSDQDKNALKIGGGFLFVFLCIAIFAIGMRVRDGKQSGTVNNKPEIELTPEQKIVVAEWRKVAGEVRQAREDIEKTKAEVYQILKEVKATAISKNLDRNVGVNWLTHGWNGEPNWTMTWIVANGKPILWGMRDDGLVMWKSQ